MALEQARAPSYTALMKKEGSLRGNEFVRRVRIEMKAKKDRGESTEEDEGGKVVNLRENELVITTITAIYSAVVILTELVSKSVPTS